MKRFEQGTELFAGVAALSEVILQPPESDIEPFAGEPVGSHMRWECWDTGFSSLAVPGMLYEGCQFAVNYFKYAVRGNRDKTAVSRSQAIVSNWSVANHAFTGFGEANIRRVTAFFPVFDGVGLWIARRRREESVYYYTHEQEKNIARISALGALGIGHAFAEPKEPGHLVYRCIWAYGKVFGPDGKMLPSAANLAFAGLGLTPQELVNNEQSGGT